MGAMIIFPNPHTPIKPILQMRNVWLRDCAQPHATSSAHSAGSLFQLEYISVVQ